MPVIIQKSSFQFLQRLARNNNRDWFNKHKDEYMAAHENIIAFADALLEEMRKHDHLETASGKSSLMRIYRDTRFSSDKTPYRLYFGGGFSRATKKLRGGYYFQIGPGHSMMAGGFFSPNPSDLLRIRTDIDMNHSDWEKLLSQKKIRACFGNMKGEKLATAPRGFDKNHPGVELLRHKQFYLEHRFADADVLAPSFLKELNQCFKNLRPYFDYMSEVLTTDGNGVSLV
jgi:uncharacterized protein (TIGR02453 family)